MRFVLLALSIVLCVPETTAWADGAITLNEVFAEALKRADTVNIDLELIHQAEETNRQAKGAMLPNIVGTGAFMRQQDVTNAFGATISPTYQPLIKIAATQPLFVGLKDFAALRQTEHLIGASKLDRDAAIVQLYKDVTTNFFTITSAERDLSNVKAELAYYDQRIAELERFKRIGRSQLTDVLSAKTAQATLHAAEMQINGQIAANRQIMTVLTGLDAKTPLKVTLQDDLPRTLEAKERYLAQMEQRPEIQAAIKRASSAAETIQIARSGHLPTVQLTGDYYLQRAGALKDVTWDVTLGVTMPIFSGGIVTSQVDAAASVKRQADDVLSQARHAAEQEIRSVYDTLLADKAQLDALKVATDLAKKTYEAQTHDYRLGLVTNLDVLTSLTSFQENQRALDRQRYTLLMDFERLEAAVGRRPLGFMLSVATPDKGGAPQPR